MLFRDLKSFELPAFPSAFSSYVPRSRKVYGCILVSPNDKILLVKGRLSGKWSLPKGHMEGRENDLQCALRELYEETGIQPDVKYSYFKKFATGGYFIYFMESEPVSQIQPNLEISEVAWFALPEIRKLNCNLDLNCFFRWMKKNCLHPDDCVKTIFTENSQEQQQDPLPLPIS
jgi:8-oxo-dGTP pyrophosphatase MutT (NUDIX family)